jgi:hypothetical protein
MSEPAKRYYKTFSDNMHLQSENARLKAEVERLRASSFVTAVPSHQYERVIKAGDAMAERLMYQGYPATVPAWNAAKNGWDADKEGKPGA